MPLITFENVDLQRAGRKLFSGFSLSVTEHRIGLVGHNGSGKSSLLRLIHGLLKPDAGTVRTLGLDTAKEASQLPAQVGFLFQNPDHQILFPTVSEEISFGLLNQGLHASEVDQRVKAILTDYGCEAWGKRAVDELSGGQKQLVCLMAVMVLEPRLLLLDEPFASLDFATRLSFIKRMRKLQPGAVIASHDLELLQDCDRVLWLEQGAVKADGHPKDILPAYQAEAIARAEKEL
ncbi:energy-coupling factor ABC transporter ATP-binding protein [Hohaiivirga grylli]|uniref:energy-coupling factor ABC transporter ATP-binding protein n=1 Tax=Hohaiivirga grylli TaxID=3133970 RepID=UPI0031FE9D57